MKGEKEDKVLLRTYPGCMAVFLQVFIVESCLPQVSEHSESLNSRDNLEGGFRAVCSVEQLLDISVGQ